MAIEILKGLDYAHRKTDINGKPINLIHRDMSPQNIMISYDGEVKIVDFGIAKTESKLNRTQAGVLKGKFGYMSPEQASGLELDARTDIFSTGIILFEMLTGRRLFLGETDWETLEKIKECKVPPPTKYNPAIPPELEQLVFKTLSKERENRFSSSQEMLAALAKIFYTSYGSYSARELSDFLKNLFVGEIEQEQEALRRAIDSLPPDELEAVISSAESAGDRIMQSSASRRTQSGNSHRISASESKVAERTLPKTPERSSWKLLKVLLMIALPALTVFFAWKWMTHSGPKQSVPPVAKSEMVSASIDSDPRGAQISIDGDVKGNTPLQVQLASNSPHKLQLTLSGYERHEETVTAVPPDKLVFGPYALLRAGPASGSLEITSIPSGAGIFLNGQDTHKKTPATMDEIALNEPIEIRLLKRGYQTKKRSFILRTATDKFNETLEPRLVTISLEIVPKETQSTATVFLDGTERGYDIENVEVGRKHQVKVSAPGFQSRTVEITSEDLERAGKEYRYKIALKKIEMSTVNFDAKPWAYVLVDGKQIGESPQIDIQLSIGSHMIEFRNPDYKSIQKKIQVRPGKKQNVIVRFDDQ